MRSTEICVSTGRVKFIGRNAIEVEDQLEGNHLSAEYQWISRVVFTIPPLASVGLSQYAAEEKGLKFRINHSEIDDWYSNKRVAAKPAAFKVLVEEETFNLFTMAMRFDLRVPQLKQILFAYPTHASDIKYMF